MIAVTRPYLPDIDKVKAYLDGIYERQWLTNQGPLHQALTTRLEDYLGVSNLVLVANGTLALQIAFRVLGIGPSVDRKSQAITTPFTFIATASALKWEGVHLRFVDIDPESWCLDPYRIEEAMTEHTQAIVPVHVFGNPCDVNAIEKIATRNDLKVIYDGAHAFGVKGANKSLLSNGDATTLSFHATKVFHCVEGGAIIFRNPDHAERARRIINFGIDGQGEIREVGINAKMNEFQCAMGLAVLDEMEENMASRALAWNTYHDLLKGVVGLQGRSREYTNNYSYFPILLKDEVQLSRTLAALGCEDIGARRYFYPSLNRVSCLGTDEDSDLSVAESVASRVLCLPLYSGVPARHVAEILLSSIMHKENECI